MKRLTCVVLICFAALSSSPAWALPGIVSPVEVYWDSHPGNIGHPTAYIPSARYSRLVDHLAPLGYHFSEGADQLDALDLRSTDILVISAASNGIGIYTPAALEAINVFVQQGGGLLLMSDNYQAPGADRLQQVLGLFGAAMQRRNFDSLEVRTTSILDHPAVQSVHEIDFPFSSPLLPGTLTPVAFDDGQVMVAAGEVGFGRVVVIADTEPFAKSIVGPPDAIDVASHRQLATSTFAWLAVPEPTSIGSCMLAAFFLKWASRRYRSSDIKARQ